MTTNVTVTTHDWPVEITEIDNGFAECAHKRVLPPHSEQTFAIWDSRQVFLKELPKPEEIEDKSSAS